MISDRQGLFHCCIGYSRRALQPKVDFNGIYGQTDGRMDNGIKGI